MAKTRMKIGDCKIINTPGGKRKLCRTRKGMRFRKMSTRSGGLSGTKRRGRKGKTCIRRKRVRMKSGGTALRCAKFK